MSVVSNRFYLTRDYAKCGIVRLTRWAQGLHNNNSAMWVPGEAFWEARFIEAGLTLDEAARICGVNVKTITRWERKRKRGAPYAAFQLVKLYGGNLTIYGKSWAGWKIKGDSLYDPSGGEYPLSDIRCVAELRALVRTYERQEASGTLVSVRRKRA